MKRALFASDYDGTLCRGGRIDEDTLAAAARFRAQGGLFGVCSGRDPGTLKAELAQFGLACDFLIMMNGARIEADGSCLREITLQGYDCVLPLLRERTQFFAIIGNGMAYLSECDPKSEMPQGDQRFVQEIRRTYRLMPQPDDLPVAYQISCRTEHDSAAVALADELHTHGLCAYPNCEYVDIVPAGVGKAEAVDAVREHYRLPVHAVWTAGDGRNDMEMLSRFSGFAMMQAEDCVKQAAGRTADSVGRALEHIIMEEQK